MLLVSEVEETEIFKICLEYWNHLAAELYRESPFSTSSTPLLSDVPPRRHLYLPVLSQVRPAHTQTVKKCGTVNVRCFYFPLWKSCTGVNCVNKDCLFMSTNYPLYHTKI